jgi:hypothetical protein
MASSRNTSAYLDFAFLHAANSEVILIVCLFLCFVRSAEAILQEFYKIRMELYVKRKEHLESELQKELSKLSNR